jgi:hypothetical protein
MLLTSAATMASLWIFGIMVATVTARYLQVYDLQIYDVSLPQNYGSPRVRILRPHRSSLVFPIRQLYESRPLQFSATLDALGNDMGLYPC